MDRYLVDSITVSISTILLLLGIENYFKEFLYGYALWLVAFGMLILIFGRFVMKDFQSSIAKKLLANSVGVMLLITGLDYWLETHMASYGLLYIIIGIVLFNYHGYLSKTLGG